MEPRTHPRPVVRGARALLVGVVALAACGVEVPDDVAVRATSTTATTEAAPPTTEAPTSDDELEQALLDNGYTEAEARCGAEALRERLDDDQVDEIVGADSVTDINEGTAADFADAIGGCLEEGSDSPRPGGRPGGDRGDDGDADEDGDG